MVSAVFHSPLDASRQLAREKHAAAARITAAQRAAAKGRAELVVAQAPEVQSASLPRRERAPIDTRAIWLAVLPPVIGIALLIGIWALLTINASAFPTPKATFEAAVKLFADPFYRNGPNDQGIGWNILFSLERVAVGFGMAALVGIPLGFLIGRFAFLNRMINPLISLLRPVSPLAWLPIGLLVFKAADRKSTRLNSSHG